MNIGKAKLKSLSIGLKVFFDILFWVSVVSAAISLLFLMSIVISHNLRLLLKTVANDRPFEKNNAKRLFIISIVLIIGSVVWKIIEGVYALTIVNILKIESIDVNFTIDGAMLLTGFLILILAGVFRYGSYLQDEYDTTL